MIRFGRDRRTVLASMALLLAAAVFPLVSHGQHGNHGKSIELGTGAAFDKDGRLWAVTKETGQDGQFVVIQSSLDAGRTWSAPRRVHPESEPVVARGEARPKIAFGDKGEIYIAYTRTIAKPHIGDIRFVRSLDGGKTFSSPVTVHANREVITHSFESMLVDRQGRIYVAWIDGRDQAAAKRERRPYAGSAVYYAVSTDGGASFRGDHKIADHVCECCRISLSLHPDGSPVAMWRHIFAPNIRDHAMAELTPDGMRGKIQRVTFDDWRVDACPHHGPSVAFASDGTRHQVWFNGREDEGGGIQYAAIRGSGKQQVKPVSLGTAQAAHADVAVQDKRIAVVWKQFDGRSTAVMARLSSNGGASWTEKELARTSAASDKPYLITGPSGIVLVWNTQDKGIRIVPATAGQ